MCPRPSIPLLSVLDSHWPSVRPFDFNKTGITVLWLYKVGNVKSVLSSSFPINKSSGSLTFSDQQMVNLQKVMSTDSKSPKFVTLYTSPKRQSKQ